MVHVLVQDQNDHAPVFDALDYVVTVDESIPAESDVIAVTASDEDDGVNALLRYGSGVWVLGCVIQDTF